MTTAVSFHPFIPKAPLSLWDAISRGVQTRPRTSPVGGLFERPLCSLVGGSGAQSEGHPCCPSEGAHRVIHDNRLNGSVKDQRRENKSCVRFLYFAFAKHVLSLCPWSNNV